MGIPHTPQYLYSFQGCSVILSSNSLPTKDTTFEDIVDIHRKQTELSQTIVTQQARILQSSSEPPMFYGDTMEFPTFITIFESLIEAKVDDSCERWYFLGQLKKVFVAVYRGNLKGVTKKQRRS